VVFETKNLTIFFFNRALMAKAKNTTQVFDRILKENLALEVLPFLQRYRTGKKRDRGEKNKNYPKAFYKRLFSR
jgi:hypothetical protein